MTKKVKTKRPARWSPIDIQAGYKPSPYPNGAVGELLRACEAVGGRVTRSGLHCYTIAAPGGSVVVRRHATPRQLQATRERLRMRGIRLNEKETQ